MSTKRERRQDKQESGRKASAASALGRRWVVASIVALVVIAITLAVFRGTLSHGFLLWDDHMHVVGNELLDPVSLENVARFWTEPLNQHYVPASYSFWAGEVYLSNAFATETNNDALNPYVFHLGNWLLHGLCVLLVFVILLRLTDHVPAAACGSLLFALHPLQVESVSWVSETRGLLAGLFSLAAIWLYLLSAAPGRSASQSSESPTHDADDRPAWQKWVLYAVASLFFVLALFSKPSAAAVPLIVLVIDWAWLRRPWRQWAPAVGIWIALAGVCTIINKSAQPDAQIDFVAPVALRPLIATDALAFYLYKIIWPVELAADYGRTPQRVIGHGWLYFTWLLPAAVIAIACWPKNRRVWLVSLGLLAAGLASVLGLVPFEYQDISTVADRYMYLALFGPAFALAWSVKRFSHPIWLTGCAIGLVFFGVRSYEQIPLWNDDESLFTHTLTINDESYVGHLNLGDHLAFNEPTDVPSTDAQAAKERCAEGLAHLTRAIAIDPADPRAHHSAGSAAALLGRIPEAIEHYTAALEAAPDHVASLLDLGKIEAASGRPEKAADRYRHALDVAKNKEQQSTARALLAVALAQMGEDEKAVEQYIQAKDGAIDEAAAHLDLGFEMQVHGLVPLAERHYAQAVELRPDMATAHDRLGRMLAARNSLEEAIVHFRRTIELDPDNFEAHDNLGAALLNEANRDIEANADDAAIRAKIADAVEHLKQALRLQPRYDSAHNNLGFAYLMVDHFPEAIRCFETALKYNPNHREAQNNLRNARRIQQQRQKASGQTEPVSR